MTLNKEGSIKLYAYLSKAIKHSKNKMNQMRYSEPVNTIQQNRMGS